MAQVQLDSLDIKILQMLAANARKPYLEIARACDVSGAAIHQRIQKLTQMGVIKGSESLINPSSIGYDTCAYIGFFLKDPSQFNHVVNELEKIPEVVECHFTTGQYDMFIKLYAHNNDHLLHIIHEKLQHLGLSRTESLISFKEVFKRQIPIGNKID
ncbi:MAG: AsnC family transcriptional regulator [Bacteroidales bacterium]|nr:AsnC family transcriptional regulator [Bacteroidales bacterium]